MLLALAIAATVSVAQDVVSVVHGTVKKVDKATKTIVVKTADGTEHKGAKTAAIKSADGTEKTFQHTDHAAKDVAKSTGKGIEKGTKVTVYYTEGAGRKIAHFFA